MGDRFDGAIGVDEVGGAGVEDAGGGIVEDVLGDRLEQFGVVAVGSGLARWAALDGPIVGAQGVGGGEEKKAGDP